LGMVVLELVCGAPPYSECNNPVMVCRRVEQGKPPGALANIEEDAARAFVQQCIAHKSGDRPTVEQVLKDPFLAGASGS